MNTNTNDNAAGAQGTGHHAKARRHARGRLEPHIHSYGGFVCSHWQVKPLKGKRGGYQFRLSTGEVLFTCYPGKTFSPEVTAANMRVLLAAAETYDLMDKLQHYFPDAPADDMHDWYVEETLHGAEHLVRWLTGLKGNATVVDGEWAGGQGN